eukprot:8305739-Alexandrium_andersonii.AAC.1
MCIRDRPSQARWQSHSHIEGESRLGTTKIRNPSCRKHEHRCKRSELELRGPRKDLDIGPRSSRGARSAPLLAQSPN